MKKILFLCVLFLPFMTGCVSVGNNDKLNVVVTTTMLYDLTSIIGYGYIDVECLIGVGVDPHDYTASANDTMKITSSDIVVYNGLNLESKMTSVFESLDKDIICIENSFDEEDILEVAGELDPHIWFDVSLWIKSAKYLANSLGEIDEDNKENYYNNYLNYKSNLEILEYYIISRVLELNETQKYLITSHDAFNYFGNAYGFIVEGIQGTSTNTEVSTSDISRLSNLVLTNNIKTIFAETSTNNKNIEALKEAVFAGGGTVLVSSSELYSDSLGKSSDGHSTYITSFKANVDMIVDGLK